MLVIMPQHAPPLSQEVLAMLFCIWLTCGSCCGRCPKAIKGGIDGDLGLVGCASPFRGQTPSRTKSCWSCDVDRSFVLVGIVLLSFLVAKSSTFVASAVCGRPRGLELVGGDNALGKVEKGVTPDDLPSCD